MSYQRILQCRLTEDEQRERGQALALARGERNEREAHRSAEAKRLKALVDDADEEVDRLAAIVRSGQEPRPVECLDSLHGYEVVTVRLDTGEEVSRRAATDADRQMALPMEEPVVTAARALERMGAVSPGLADELAGPLSSARRRSAKAAERIRSIAAEAPAEPQA